METLSDEMQNVRVSSVLSVCEIDDTHQNEVVS